MKKFVLFLLMLFSNFCLFCQSPFTIGTPTIIPQNPTMNNPVKVVIKTTTSYNSTKQATTAAVNNPQQTISLSGCYYIGMAAVINEHLDTFALGQLQVGVYTLTYTAISSTSSVNCVPSSATKTIGTTFTVSGITSIKENFPEIKINVYPNPAKNKITIETPANETVKKLKLLNMLGQTVYNLELVKSKTEIDIENLPAGIYWLKPESNETIRIIKIIKE